MPAYVSKNGINRKRPSLFRLAPTHLESISSIVLSAKPSKRQDEMSSRCFLHIHSISRDGERYCCIFFSRGKKGRSVCEYSWLNNVDAQLTLSKWYQPSLLFSLSELSAAQRTHPGSLKGSFLLERSSFMTGLKVEYSWPTAVIYLESSEGIYMDRCISTFSYCVHSAPRGLLAELLKEAMGSLRNSNKTLEPKLQEALTNHQARTALFKGRPGVESSPIVPPSRVSGQTFPRIHRQWEPNCTLEVMTSSIR